MPELAMNLFLNLAKHQSLQRYVVQAALEHPWINGSS